jgi:maltose O-acetyltransferase
MRSALKFLHGLLVNITLLVVQLLPDNVVGNRMRGFVLKPFFKKCGVNLQVSKSAHILYPQNICLGDNVFLGFNCWLNGQGGLVIGSETMIGPFVSISSSNHTLDRESGSFRFAEHELKPVLIGKGVWLASHVSVNGGSSIEDTVLVASGATVVGKLESNGLYTGQPARLKRFLND